MLVADWAESMNFEIASRRIKPPALPLRTLVSLGLPAIFALLAGALAARSTTLLFLLVAVGLALWLIHKPGLLVLAFGFMAFASGWFVTAGRSGVLHSPPYVTSGWVWAGLACIVALLSGTIRLPPSRVARAGLLYLAALIYSILLAGFRTGSLAAVGDGAKALIVVLSTFAVISLLQRARGGATGLAIALGLLTFELAFSAIQFTQLPAHGAGWFTLSPEQQWWSPHAVYGTFTTLGKNGYGNIIALLFPIPLAWMLYAGSAGGKRLRIVCGVLVALTAAFVLVSLAREALLALFVGGLVIGLPRARLRFILGAIVLGIIVVLVPATNSAVNKIQTQGARDADTQDRLQTWQAVVHHASPVYLVGLGFGSAADLTRALDIHYSDRGQPGALSVAPLNPAQPITPPTENLYLRWLVEAGVFGLVALLLFFALLLRESFATSSRGEEGVWRRTLGGVVVVLMVESLFMDTLMFEQIAIAFWLVLAICVAGIASSEPRSACNPSETLRHIGEGWISGRPRNEQPPPRHSDALLRSRP